MKFFKDLLPKKAIIKLQEAIEKKCVLLIGDSFLLKVDILKSFLESRGIQYKEFILTQDDKRLSYFLTRLVRELGGDISDSIENLKEFVIRYFGGQDKIKTFIFTQFDNIVNSESEIFFWDIVKSSNSMMCFIVDTEKDLAVPFDKLSCVRIDKNCFLFGREEVVDFFKRNNIEYREKDIDLILNKTGGYGLFLRLFLSEYIENKKIPEGVEFEMINKILKERFDSLTQNEKSLLLGISCLERFDMSSIKGILGIQEPDVFINKISEKFLFIEKTEDSFYLTPLFRDFLQREMEKNPKGIILKRWIIENAADYYLSSQDFSQALFYLQKLGFYSKIIDISYNRFFDIVETAKTLEIEPLIERLPEEIRNNYVIRLFRAHIYLLTHNFNGTITEAEKVPEKELPPDLCAFLNYLKGSAYYYLSDYEKAEEFAKRGFECGKVLEEKVLYKLYNLIGAINSMNENLEEAEKAYNKAKEIAEKIIVSRKGFVLLWANIGNIHYKKGEYWKAESLYKKALELADTPDIRAYILGWLVLTYSSRGEIEKTLDTLKELYKEAKNSGRDYYLISYYSALSDYEIFRGNFEKAMFYNKKFREIYEKYKDPEILFNVKLFNSVYELITGNPERALEIAKSLEAKRETLIIEKYNLLGKIYTKLGDFEKAEEYFKKVYNSDIKNVYTKRVSLIPYFLFLFCKREYQRAKDIFREISKIPDKKALLFSLEYNLKIFPCKIDYKEVINFIRSI